MSTTLTSSHIVRSPRPEPEIPDVTLDRFVCGQGRPDDPAMIDAASGRTLSHGDLSALAARAAGGLAARAEVDPRSDVAALLWSSGTTGFPKAVELTHRNIVANIVQCTVALPLEPGHRMLGLAPFFHSMGLTPILNLPLARGAAVVSMPRFDLEGMLKAVEAHRVTHAVLPPRWAWRWRATRWWIGSTSPRSR